jgi:O-6-methylguanine DNA methyltransferase
MTMVGRGRTLLADLHSLAGGEAPAGLLPGVLARIRASRPTVHAARADARHGDQGGDAYTTLETGLGTLFVAFNTRGATAVMRAASPAEFERTYERTFTRTATRATTLPVWLERYRRSLAGERSGERAAVRMASLRFDLAALSPFERAVLRKALEIPAGEVRSYGWIAREIGRPAAVRAVGTALARNPVPLLIPCHRVVRTDGRIGEYIFGTAAKRALLAREGVDPDTLERLAREGVRYVGSDTTRIYCFPTCRAARRITRRHRVPFGSERQAAKAGYRPCRLCRPAA